MRPAKSLSIQDRSRVRSCSDLTMETREMSRLMRSLPHAAQQGSVSSEKLCRTVTCSPHWSQRYSYKGKDIPQELTVSVILQGGAIRPALLQAQGSGCHRGKSCCLDQGGGCSAGHPQGLAILDPTSGCARRAKDRPPSQLSPVESRPGQSPLSPDGRIPDYARLCCSQNPSSTSVRLGLPISWRS